MNIYNNPILKNVSLEALDLSVRPYNSLKRANINNVYDVCLLINNNGFSKIRNIGEQSIEEIINKIDTFLANNNLSLGSGNHSISSDLEQIQKTEAVREEISFPDIGKISALPLTVLEGIFGEQIIEKFLLIDIKTIGDFHNLLLQYKYFVTPDDQVLDKALRLLNLQISKKIDQGKLSPNCLYESITLRELLEQKPLEEHQKLAHIRQLIRVVESKSLTYEISQITSNLTERQNEMFLEYSLQDLTLEEIAQKQVPSVTRERIRQILSEAITKIQRQLDKSLKIYIQTAFDVAKELGTSISQDAWKAQLIKRRILVDQDQNYQSFDFFCALLKNKKTSEGILGIPESVITTLKNVDSRPFFVIRFLESDKKGNLRQLKRIVNYTGGVDLKTAEEVLGCRSEEIAGILKTQGMSEIIPGWFSYSSKTELDNKTSLFRAGLIMMQTCGSLNFESFCEGLRRYISRHFNTLAPAAVIKHQLTNFGFKIENNIVTYGGEAKVELSNSDSLLLELLQNKGLVLSFQDLVEFYREKGLSFSTATTRVMPDSPILEKIEYALYKLRGSEVTEQDLEIARSRQDETARNIEIIFGSDRIVRYRVNLGSWALGGVLSISQSLPPLPDFSEGWPVYVGEEQTGTASRDELLIWGLAGAFQKLDAKIGDRVELAIDHYKAKRIVVRIIEESNK